MFGRLALTKQGTLKNRITISPIKHYTLMIKYAMSLLFLISFSLVSCSQNNSKQISTVSNHSSKNTTTSKKNTTMSNLQTATLAAGCFWCIEAIFQDLKGVKSVQSGYTNGETKNPTYKQVCSGTTGHTEALRVEFDPAVISYEELLEVFWYAHDPTTLNRQGNDVGTQYRSGIYFHNEEQRKMAEASKKKAQANFENPIVTEIEAAETFYPAEDYHTDYYNLHGENPYCSAVIAPKIKKVRKKFGDKMKK